VPLLRQLAECGSEPLLEKWRAMSGQEVLNNAAAVVHGLRRSVPTILLITDADTIPLGWLHSPPPAGLRLVLFTSSHHDVVTEEAMLGLLRRGPDVVHFEPSSSGRSPTACLRAFDSHLLGRQLAALPPTDACTALLGRIVDGEQCSFEDAFALVHQSALDILNRLAAPDAADDADLRMTQAADGGAVARGLGHALAMLVRFPGAFCVGDLDLLVGSFLRRGGDKAVVIPSLAPAVALLEPLIRGRARPGAMHTFLGHGRLWTEHVRLQLQSQFILTDTDLEVVLEYCVQSRDMRLRVDVVLPLMVHLGQDDGLISTLTEWETLAWLYKHRSAADISRLCGTRVGEIMEVLSEAVPRWRTELPRSEYEHRAFVVGQLASQSGMFDVARDVLIATRRAESAKVGILELALAKNEIRCVFPTLALNFGSAHQSLHVPISVLLCCTRSGAVF
jgi:hypothetical protein